MALPATDTQLMRQYRALREQQPDCLLFFRLGDFYELFEEQAELVARLLDLTLTTRDGQIKMAGVPHRSVREHVRTLVALGHRVALAEQVAPPASAAATKGRTMMERRILEVITPGAEVGDALDASPEARRVAYLVLDGGAAGPSSATGWLVAADVSTGELRLEYGQDTADLSRRLHRLEPAELLLAEDTELPASLDLPPRARLVRRGADLLGAAGMATAAVALGWTLPEGLGAGGRTAVLGLVAYLENLLPGAASALQQVRFQPLERTLQLDAAAVRHLELIQGSADPQAPTLRSLLDQTRTSGGRRLLRDWILRPLDDRPALVARQEVFRTLLADPAARLSLRLALEGVRDVQRLTVRLRLGRLTPREMRALGDSLLRLPAIVAQTAPLGGRLAELGRWAEGFAPLATRLTRTLVERPPLVLTDPHDRWMQEQASSDLAAAVSRLTGSTGGMTTLVQQLKQQHGFTSLKAGESRGQGWFLEVPKTALSHVPSSWRQVSTMTNAVRYRCAELEHEERQLYRAGDDILRLQQEMWEELRAAVLPEVIRLQLVADALSELDVVVAIASVAADGGWTLPELRTEPQLVVEQAWHPVVAAALPPGSYAKADLRLDAHTSLLLVTGPNMGGKSTVLRLVALMQILAQMGAPVPAAKAVVGLADRVSTRIGAGDALARGDSTFMVEMRETAQIVADATARSLVILDELGRGTSTVDGLAIAWSVVETLAARGTRTLFATHYHELIALAEALPTAANISMAVADDGVGGVRFLHEIRPGGSDQSYGLHVAELAGVPAPVVARARAVQAELLAGRPDQLTVAAPQTSLAEGLLSRLTARPADSLTPLEALQYLAQLQQEARQLPASKAPGA